MSNARTLWSVLLLGAAISSSALAQDSEGRLRPLEEASPAEEPPVKDLGGWLGEEDMPQAEAEDPLALPEAAPAPAAPEDEELSPAEQRKRGRKIDKNYDSALEIYEELGAPTRDLTALDRRISNNERIVREYGTRIGQAREQRRQIQVELYNRMFYLRQQKEKGQIDQDVFDRLGREAERKYDERVGGLKGDIESWKREVRQAREQLDSLKSERRMLQASLPRQPRHMRKRGNAEPPPQGPGQRLLSTLETRMSQLDPFEARHTMDGVHPRNVGVSSVGKRRAPGGELAGAGEQTEEDSSWWPF